MMFRWRCLLRCAAGIWALAAAGQAAPSSLVCTASTIASRELPAADYLQCARSLLQAPRASRQLSTDALYLGLETLVSRSTTRPAADDVETLHLFVQALEARGAMRPLERRRVVDILLSNGRVDEAQAAKQYVASTRSRVLPRLEPMSSTPAPDAPRYWTWDTEANVLHEQALDLSHGAHVVVSSSPSCHFSDDLATTLPSEVALQRAFKTHAVWISRPDSAFDLQTTRDWNARHPETPLVTVFDLKGWPYPEPWSTPFLYFLRDGRVVTLVRGYEPSRIDEIRAGFRSIGIPLGE